MNGQNERWERFLKKDSEAGNEGVSPLEEVLKMPTTMDDVTYYREYYAMLFRSDTVLAEETILRSIKAWGQDKTRVPSVSELQSIRNILEATKDIVSPDRLKLFQRALQELESRS